MCLNREQAITLYRDIIKRKLPLLGFTSVNFDENYYMGRKSVITEAFHKSVSERPFCVERHSDYFEYFLTEESITHYTKYVIRLFIEAVLKHDEETRSNK